MATTKKKIFRTVIMMTVLSEYPLPEGMTIADIDKECEDGDFTGGTEFVEVNTELQGEEAAKAVLKVGSSPDFFQMDETGNDLEEEFDVRGEVRESDFDEDELRESGPFDQLGYEQTSEDED